MSGSPPGPPPPAGPGPPPMPPPQPERLISGWRKYFVIVSAAVLVVVGTNVLVVVLFFGAWGRAHQAHEWTALVVDAKEDEVCVVPAAWETSRYARDACIGPESVVPGLFEVVEEGDCLHATTSSAGVTLKSVATCE